MKNVLWLIFLFFFCDVSSQNLIYQKNIVYAKAPDRHNNVQNLNLDLFYPSDRKKSPLIVFVHGGGFEENSTKEYSTPFCERLAKNGFAVANIEYRTGFEHSFTNFKIEISKAIYRAEQDQLAAIRYLIHHASEYPFDTSAIFIAGESAGGVTSLFTAYVGQDDWDRIVPLLHEALGDISTTGNDLNDQFKIRGVINLWGGISDTALISGKEVNALPALLFHSIDDADIPFEQASHREAKNKLLQGSHDIADRFKNNYGCYELHYIHNAGHAYGFSSDYLSNAISRFTTNVIEGKCTSTEIENKGNINLSFVDSDSDAVQKVDDKIIALSPEILQQYAGQYQGNGVTITIHVDSDHLKVEAPGGKTFELYPVKEDVFVEKKLHIQTTFTRDAQGNVVEHEVIHTQNRQLRYKKIK